jgi:peptide-methionine (R)-S-oxide reductase
MSEPETHDLPDTDEEWREVLTEEEYRVLREQGTEPKFSSDLLDVKGDGSFDCAGCGAELFDGDTKFGSGTGWPSFYDAEEGAVELREDRSHGMVRTEVVCAECGGHLGHVFDDGPEPTGKRFCINGVAIEYDQKE